MKHPELFHEIAEYLRADIIELESERGGLIGTLMGQDLRITNDSICVGVVLFCGTEALQRGTAEDREKIRDVCGLAVESWARMLAKRLEHARKFSVAIADLREKP